ncbi:30S ribosomal protein S5 alanine N-acetyltransferase [Shewanella sp. OPT22]|nr:30S ribosomal protein S5 alanine N-acetyltransferase [Shewanella sp. OPT22]
MTGNIIAETQQTLLVVPMVSDAKLIREYYLNNKSHLSNWEPIRESSYYDVKTWEEFIRENERAFETGSSVKLVAMNKERTEVIGVCNFSNIIRGVFQACNLGYSIDQQYQGQGLMYEILDAAIKYIFLDIGLHRIMANYMPENKRSEALLERLGFEREGVAKSYLKINGKWRDHILTSKVNLKD